MDTIFFQVVWVPSSVVTIIAALLAGRSTGWRHVGRAATAALLVVGQARVHFSSLFSGVDYSDFADSAHFDWVTDTWRVVVGPRQLLFVGLLTAFEVIVGLLVIGGGRLTRAGYGCVIAFYLALWVFGPIETIVVLVMLAPMWLLLRAEQQASRLPPAAARHTAASAPRGASPAAYGLLGFIRGGGRTSR